MPASTLASPLEGPSSGDLFLVCGIATPGVGHLCNQLVPGYLPSSASLWGGVGLPPGTMMEAWTNAKNEQMRAWLAVAVTAAAASPMVTSLLESAHATPLILRLVQANAPSTLSNYLGRWKQWQSFCDVQSVDSWSPSVSFMCDFLITHCKGQLGSAVGWLKALRFVSFRLEVPTLKSVLQSEAVRAFGKSVNIVQRRKTAPFPLSFVIWLERQVLDASQTAAQRIRCGFLLVCVFASLRWSDAQWSPPSFLHCERQAILGTAVRTKTTSRSMPWGAWAPGFLARPQTAAGWGQIWLCLVQEAVVRTTSAKPGFRPDFLVADLGPDEREPVFTAPLNRSAGVVLIRQLLTRCYEHVEPAQRPDLSLIGVHSAKVTLLSVAKQLLLDESLRREQGHHRAPAGQAMSRLYGRDDVAGPLSLQSSVVQAVAGGFRPLRPALRGGAPSLPDVFVAIPPLEGGTSETKAGPGIPRLSDREPLQLDQDSSSDSEDASADLPAVESASAAPAAEWELVPQGRSTPPDVDLGEPEEFEFLFNPLTKIVHVARACAADHPACQFRPSADAEGVLSLRPGCSVRGNLAVGSLLRVSEIPKGARLCLKHGCGKDPALAPLLES